MNAHKFILDPHSPLHAQISSTVLRSATTHEISEQHDYNQASQSTTNGNGHNIRRIIGIAVLGQVIAIRVPIVERLPLHLGQSNGRRQLVRVSGLCRIEGLLAIAVV